MTRDQWESMATATFVPVRISRVAPNFTGDMTHSGAGFAGVSHVKAGPCEVVRTRHEIGGFAEGLAAFAVQLSGEVGVAQPDSQVRASAGNGFLYFTDEPYTLTFPTANELLIVQAPAEEFGVRREELGRLRSQSITAANDPDLQTFVRMLRAHLGGTRAEGEAERTNRVALELVSRAFHRRLGSAPPQRSHEAMLAALKNRVAASLDDLRLDIGSLARAEGISQRTVHNVFETIGTTPAHYISQARIARAQHLLRTTNLRIADVAAATGFADHSTMTRVFRRELGQTPRECRDAVADTA